MNAQSFVMNYGIIWLYYSPISVEPAIEDEIRINYEKLGITLNNMILKTCSHLQDVLNYRWKDSSIVKIAIKVLNLEHLGQINSIFEEQPNFQLSFYKDENQLKKLVQKGFHQMQKFKLNNNFEDLFQNISKHEWKTFHTFFINFFIIKSDCYFSQERFTLKFNQYFESIQKKRQNMEINWLNYYMELNGLSSFVKHYQKQMHIIKNCGMIGYSLRKIYPQLKKRYKQNHSYSNLDELTAWKLIYLPQNDRQRYSKNQYYLHKLIQDYSMSFESLLQDKDINSQILSQLGVLKIIIKQKDKKSIRDCQNLIHGFFLSEGRMVTINCMNILKLRNVGWKKVSSLLPNLEDSSQRQLKDSLVFVMQLQLISFNDLIKQNRATNNIKPTEQMQWLRKQCAHILNFLKRHQFIIKLEDMYIENNQMNLAQTILYKKKKQKRNFNRQLWRKLACEQELLEQQVSIGSSQKNISQYLDLCKSLQKRQEYLKCLKIYIQSLASSKDSLLKYAKRGQALIQISLFLGMNLESSEQYHQYLQAATLIIKQLSPDLSTRTFKDKKQTSFSCMNIFSCWQQKRSFQQINAELSQKLLSKYFQKIPQLRGNQQLRLLRYKICKLFYTLNVAVQQIFRYGRRNENLIKMRDFFKDQVFCKDIDEIGRIIRLNDQNNDEKINDIIMHLNDSHQIIEEKSAKMSVIKQFPIKQEIKSQKSIIRYEIQQLQIIDWNQTKSSISNLQSNIHTVLSKVEDKYIQLDSFNVDKNVSKAIQKALEICQTQIKYLREDHYYNCSIALLKVFKRQMNLYFKLNSIQGLKKMESIPFQKDQKKHIFLFKAELYQKMAFLSYKNEKFIDCQQYVIQSRKYYEKGSQTIIKTYMNLILLEFKAKSMYLMFDSTKNKKQKMYQSKKIEQQLIKSLQASSNLHSSYSRESLKIYQIKAKLIALKLREIDEPISFSEIIQQYRTIRTVLKDFYKNQSSIQFILLNVEILRRHYENDKLVEFATQLKEIYQCIEKVFDTSMDQNAQLKDYKWIKDLSNFFKEREKGQKYVKVLPARNCIEKCIYSFKQLRNQNRMTVELKYYYEKVYIIYKSFMQRSLSFFQPKQHLFLSEQMKKQKDSKAQNYYTAIDSHFSHYRKIYWILFLDSGRISQAQIQEVKLLYRQKYFPIAFSAKDFIKISTDIWNLDQDRRSTLVRYSSNIKIIIDVKGIEELISSQNEDHLKNTCELNLLLQENSESALKEIKAHFIQKKIDRKLIFINKLQQKMNEIKHDANQLQENRSLYPNVLFYIKQFSHKNNRFNTIMLSSISEKQYEKDKGYKGAINNLKASFLKSYSYSGDFQIDKFIEKTISLNKIRKCIFQIDNEQQIAIPKGQLYAISHEIIKGYQKQSLFYHFANNTIRSFSKDIDFDWKGFQYLINPLYHSIFTLHTVYKESLSQGQTLTVWRKAKMKQQQYQLFQKMSLSRPPVKFYQFLSTSLSLNWVINQFCFQFQKNEYTSFDDYVIFKFEIKITKEFLNSALNHGFCKLIDQCQFQVLFNILNVFRVEKVSEVFIDDLLQKYKKNAQIKDEKIKDSQKFNGFIRSNKIRFIEFSMEDYTDILQSRQQKKTQLSIFQQIQSTFIKKRRLYQTQKNGVRMINYQIDEAYKDLGQPDKANEELQNKLVESMYSYSNLQQIISSDGVSMIRKIAQNYIKMGKIEKARIHMQLNLPKFENLKEEFIKLKMQSVFQNELYEMKFILIEIFNEKIDVSKYEDNINSIEEEIRQIKYMNEFQRLNKRTKEIYLHFHRSLYYYQIHEIKKSLQYFSQTISILQDVVKQVKRLDTILIINQLNRDQLKKIKKCCQDITQRLHERSFLHIQSLNKSSYKQITSSSSKMLQSTTVSFLSDKSLNDLQSNTVCLGAAASSIQIQSNSSFEIVSQASQQMRTLSQVSEDIQLESSRLSQPLQTTEMIKFANFMLLGKLETQKQEILYASNKNMTNIMNNYHAMTLDNYKYQIDQLKKEGHLRQSIPLIRIYKKVMHQKFLQGSFDSNELKHQISKNLTFCKNDQNKSKKIQACRLLIFKAEILYQLTEHKLIVTRYKNINNQENIYEESERCIDEAEKELRSAYGLQDQDFSWSRETFTYFQSKEKKMYRLSHENLSIHLLKLKIMHRKFRNYDPLSKDKLMTSLGKLAALVSQMRSDFDVINQQAMVYQMYCIYGLILPKQLKFTKYSRKFTLALEERENTRAANNIQNALDCLQLFELLHSRLRDLVPVRDYDIFYRYVERGTRSSENNDLFWRFVICKFNQITKAKQQTLEEYCLIKLEYIQGVLMLLNGSQNVKQLMVSRIYESYTRFKKREELSKDSSSDKIKRKIRNIQETYKNIVNKMTFLQRFQQIEDKPSNNLSQNKFKNLKQIKVQLPMENKNQQLQYRSARHEVASNQQKSKSSQKSNKNNQIVEYQQKMEKTNPDPSNITQNIQNELIRQQDSRRQMYENALFTGNNKNSQSQPLQIKKTKQKKKNKRSKKMIQSQDQLFKNKKTELRIQANQNYQSYNELNRQLSQISEIVIQ